MPDLSVDLAPRHPRGLRLRNPVMVASGLWGRDGYGEGIPPGVDYTRLGAIVAKSVTRHPREGNPDPKYKVGWLSQGLYAWALNSVGLKNPGIEAVLREHAPRWATWGVPVVLSLAGESVEGFAELARRAEGTPGIAGLELNLSCPNVRGGLQFGQDPALAGEVVRAVKSATSLPVLAKLTPNLADIRPVARACAEAGADALVLTNTLVGMAIDLEARRPRLGGITGGVSGPALKPVALAMVYQVAGEVDIPLVGVGGIRTAEDALEYLMAGATAVQVGTEAYFRPQAPLEVLEGLARWMEARGVARLADLVGCARLP